jgi:hypothetical protein
MAAARRCLGSHMRAELTIAALTMTIQHRRPRASLIHSDS